MKSYYSLIRCYNNPLSKENIVIGLIMISGTDFYFDFSVQKIRLWKRYNKQNSNVIDFTIKNFSKYIASIKGETLFKEQNVLDLKNVLNYLSVYNNGLFQVDEPQTIDMVVSREFYENFYKKYVGALNQLPKNVEHRAKEQNVFESRIERDFYFEVKNKIDVDFKINKKYVPSLFFEYKLNGIGANGSVYTVKCLDINAGPSIDNIRRDIAELESMAFRLNLFSKEIVEKPESNRHFLVMDSYHGEKEEFVELYDSISSQEKYTVPYELISSEDLNIVTSTFKENDVKKFTEIVDI